MSIKMGGYRSMNMEVGEEVAIKEAASAGVKSMEHLLHLLSQPQQQQHEAEYRQVTEATVGKFKKLISALNHRTGHARFRRARAPPSTSSDSSNSSESLPLHPQQPQITTKVVLPHVSQPEKPIPVRVVPLLQPQPQPQQQPLMTLDFSKPNPNPNMTQKQCDTVSNSSFSISSSSSFLSSITGEGSVSNGKQFWGGSLFVAPPSCSGKPPLSSSSYYNKSCHRDVDGKMTRCHCPSSKRKKMKVKKSIRVPAISSKTADIPADDFSWRKYGQKPIKGSPYPRGYYKCSTVRGCPARKHVERATDDPTMLIVTYEGEHRHSPVPATHDNSSISISHNLNYNHVHHPAVPATTATPAWLQAQPILTLSD